MKNATSTISFRAPNQMLQQIDRQRAPFGISRGEWVRGAVQHYLQQLETPQEAETLATVREDILHRAAYEAAYIVAELHAHEYLFPDIHGDQFLIARNRPTVLIDTGSCQFTSAGRLYPCVRVREEYQPPELLGAQNWADVADQRDEHTDAWSLNFLIFQLTLGCGPFDGTYIGPGVALPPSERMKQGFFPFEKLGDYRPPKNSPPYRHVDPDIQEFFHRCFVDGRTREKRHLRPSPADWADLLRHCRYLRTPSQVVTQSLQSRPAAPSAMADATASLPDWMAQLFQTIYRTGWTTAIALAATATLVATSHHLITTAATGGAAVSTQIPASSNIQDEPLLHQPNVAITAQTIDSTNASQIDSLLQRLRNKPHHHDKEPNR